MVRGDDRRHLAHQEPRDGLLVSLALEHPGEAGEVRIEPILGGVPLGRLSEVADHLVDVVLEVRDLARRLDIDRARQVALRDGRRDVCDRAELRRQRLGELVHVVGQALPHAGDAFDLRLPAKLPFGADFLRDAGHLGGERRELVDHRVDRPCELSHLALGRDGDLLREIALRDRGRHVRDVPHLVGEVVGKGVDVLGQPAPGAGDAFNLRLAAQLALGPDLAGDARDLGGERAELVDHRVDGLLQLEHLALHVHSDLPREVAVRDRGRDGRDVSHLAGEVVRQGVDVLRQVLPYARDALHLRLTAELPVGADLARDARHLVGEEGELVDHRVHGVLQLQHLALDVHGDLP